MLKFFFCFFFSYLPENFKSMVKRKYANSKLSPKLNYFKFGLLHFLNGLLIFYLKSLIKLVSRFRGDKISNSIR